MNRMPAFRSFRCSRRTPKQQQPLEDWARSLIADPSRYRATEHEAGIVAALLLEVAR